MFDKWKLVDLGALVASTVALLVSIATFKSQQSEEKLRFSLERADQLIAQHSTRNVRKMAIFTGHSIHSLDTDETVMAARDDMIVALRPIKKHEGGTFTHAQMIMRDSALEFWDTMTVVERLARDDAELDRDIQTSLGPMLSDLCGENEFTTSLVRFAEGLDPYAPTVAWFKRTCSSALALPADAGPR